MPRILNESFEMVPVTLLRPHPRNAREGDVGAVYESIKANGFFGSLIVQKSSCYIIAGNHRYLAALQLGFEELPVTWIDVSDEDALRILLADNKTSDLATYNNVRLAEILAELENTSEKKLQGTGYTASDLEDLIKDLARSATPSEAEPPKQRGEDSLAIVLLCQDEDEQEHLHDRLKEMGYYPRKTTLNERTTLAVGRA